MIKDFTNTDFTAFTAPMEKLISLNVSKFETAVEKQTAAAKELVELTEARTKAMAEIRDYDGMTKFLNDQNKLVQSSIAKAIEDSKNAIEEAKAYGEEVKKIFTESFETLTSAKKSTKKQS